MVAAGTHTAAMESASTETATAAAASKCVIGGEGCTENNECRHSGENKT
jgi:hypothetical protein